MAAPSAPPVILLAALVDLFRPPSPFPSSLLLFLALLPLPLCSFLFFSCRFFSRFLLFRPSLSPSAPAGRLFSFFSRVFLGPLFVSLLRRLCSPCLLCVWCVAVWLLTGPFEVSVIPGWYGT